MKQFALIVAGGSGTRMGTDTPKQFLLLNHKPVLMHTLTAFHSIPDIEIVLVLPEQQMAYWRQLCETHHFEPAHTLVSGGTTRFHSVKNGLSVIPDGALVAIHDGVRPVISSAIILESFKVAETHGTAIAAIPCKDSIREQMMTGETRSVNRNNYYLIQTPQTFQTSLIKRAYQEAIHENFTDDAGVAEEARIPIRLISGDHKNIKITTPEDLDIASIWAKPIR